SRRSCSVRPALRAGSGLGVGICVSRGRNSSLSGHDKPYADQTSRLTDAHYATFGGEHTKRFGVVPGCCTSWSRRSPRQLRAVGRSLRSGRGALCRSAVRRSDLGPAATPRGDGSAAACLPCGHGDDAAVWILALPDQRRAACDGRHPTGRPPAGRRRGLVDRGHRHRGGTERDRPHGRPRAPPRGRSGAGHRAAVPFSARSRVHEYGGTAWTALPAASDGAERPLVLFVNFTDQRIHAFREGERPRPLSPVGPEVTTAGGPSLRWACPTPVTLPGGEQEVWWICEDHTGG